MAEATLLQQLNGEIAGIIATAERSLVKVGMLRVMGREPESLSMPMASF